MPDQVQGFRLSPQQKHLWSLQQGSPAYGAQSVILIEGDCALESLKKALQTIIHRHEIFRTRFHRTPGIKIPIQVITQNAHLNWRDADLSRLSPSQQEAEIAAVLRNEASLINAEQGDVFRACLLTLSPHRQALMVTLSPLCADAWTLNNLVHEIGQILDASLRGGEADMEAVQYVAFSEWQNELLEEPAAGERWQPAFKPHQLMLPCEGKRAEPAVDRLAAYELRLGPDSSRKIAALAAAHNVRVSSVLLAGWQTLLWRLTGERDLAVANLLSGRRHEDVHQAMGLFAKSIPLHCRFADEDRFTEVLARVDRSQSEADEWQDYFFEEQSLTDNEGGSAIGFEFEERSWKLAIGRLTLSVIKQYVCISRYKIGLACFRRGDELIAEFRYDSALFRTEDIERMAGQFHVLMESACQLADASISELNILSPSERQYLISDFNDTEADYSRDTLLQQVFEDQSERTPDRIAVDFEGEYLTYRELNCRVNQLARYLQKQGVRPGALAAIYAERSPQLIVGILAILKAGGAYLPLNPGYPKRRLAFMLEDSGAVGLLTQQRRLNDLPAIAHPTVCLDTEWEAIARESGDNFSSGATPENLAYVIYTSGSTGSPKGAMITHGSLMNYLRWCVNAYGVNEGRAIPIHSPIGFDLTITSLFPPLMVGQRLRLLREEPGIDALKDALCSERDFSLVKITPAHLDLLSQMMTPEQAAGSARALVIGGEALSAESLSFWVDHAPETRLINEYGPTETVVGCCVYELPRGTHTSGAIPIGRPIANTQVYILDSRLQPVPIGVTGELYIGGDGVAWGYLNRPDLTADKFIPDPFTRKAGARLYKTGDLARHQADGNIEFLGRNDYQVKIRGYRIEAGEIEDVLQQHTGVRQAIVIAREASATEKRLVAYLVATGQGRLKNSELRNYLAERLPEYMQPSAYVTLDTLPLTPNGKVDRKALPPPESIKQEARKPFVAPRNRIEEMLAHMWEEILGLERVGIHDNIFELGGDSIRAIQLTARANQAGIRLTSNQLFQYQTIASLAAVAGVNQMVQAEQGSVMGEVSLTPIQLWFFEKELANPHHFNQSALLETDKPLEYSLLLETFRHLIEHHDALRLRFEHWQSGWRQFNAPPGDEVPVIRMDFSTLPEHEHAAACEAAADQIQTGLNLSQGPLLRAALIHFGPPRSDRLLIAIHHLAIDGVSWRILMSDLQTAYEQLSRGEMVKLPRKTTSYRQWSERLGEFAASEKLRQELSYWLEGPRPPIHPLPLDYPRAERRSTAGSTRVVSAALSAERTASLISEVPQSYRIRTEEILLTALVQTFAQWTGSRWLRLDLDSHGRQELFADVDVSRTVGWFTALYPVLLNLDEFSQASDSGDELRAIKEQVRRVPNRGIGYGLLRYLSKDAAVMQKLRELPQAEVSFNYLGNFDDVLAGSSPFKPLDESAGSDKDRQAACDYLIEVNALVLGGELRLDWTYSEDLHRCETLEGLAQRFIIQLESLIDHCRSAKTAGYTPSDFPKSKLSPKELDDLIAKFGAEGRG